MEEKMKKQGIQTGFNEAYMGWEPESEQPERLTRSEVLRNYHDRYNGNDLRTFNYFHTNDGIEGSYSQECNTNCDYTIRLYHGKPYIL